MVYRARAGGRQEVEGFEEAGLAAGVRAEEEQAALRHREVELLGVSELLQLEPRKVHPAFVRLSCDPRPPFNRTVRTGHGNHVHTRRDSRLAIRHRETIVYGVRTYLRCDIKNT